MVQEIGLTAKIKPETDTRTAKKEAGKLKGIFEDELEDLNIAAGIGMSALDKDMDSLQDRLNEMLGDQSINIKDVDMGGGASGLGLMGMIGAQMLGEEGGSGESSSKEEEDNERGAAEEALKDMAGDGFVGDMAEGFLGPKAGMMESFMDFIPDSLAGKGGKMLGRLGAGPAPEEITEEGVNEGTRKAAEGEQEGSGGLAGALGKGARVLFLGGLALDALMSIKDTMGTLANSSPLLDGVLNMFSVAMGLFFRPFGNFLGKMLYPAMESLLQLGVDFNKVYSSQGLYSALTYAAREGGQLVGKLIKGVAYDMVPWLIGGVGKGLMALGAMLIEFTKGFFEGLVNMNWGNLSILEKIFGILSTFIGGLSGASVGAAIGFAIAGPIGSAIGGVLGGSLGATFFGRAGQQAGEILDYLGDLGTGFRQVTDPLKSMGEATGMVAGALMGMYKGAMLGAAAGSAIPGMGTVVGALAGALGGAVLGAGIGKIIGEGIDTILGGIADGVKGVFGYLKGLWPGWVGPVIPSFVDSVGGWLQQSPGLIPPFPSWDTIMDAAKGGLSIGGEKIEGLIDLFKTAMAIFFRPFSPLADIFKLMYVFLHGVWKYFTKGKFLEDFFKDLADVPGDIATALSDSLGGLGLGDIKLSLPDFSLGNLLGGFDLGQWIDDNLSLAGVVNAFESALPSKLNLKSIISGKISKIKNLGSIIKGKLGKVSKFGKSLANKIPKVSVSPIVTKIKDAIPNKINPFSKLTPKMPKLPSLPGGGGLFGKLAESSKGAFGAKGMAKGALKGGMTLKGGIGGLLKGALKGAMKGGGLGVFLGMPGGGAAFGGAAGGAKGAAKGAKGGYKAAEDLIEKLGGLRDTVVDLSQKLKRFGSKIADMVPGMPSLGGKGGALGGIAKKIPGLGKAKGLAKGLGKKVPGLGTLLYGAEGALAAKDVMQGKTKNDAESGKKLGSVAGGAAGGTAGATIGGALGSLIAPVIGTTIGAVAGGLIGDWLGRKLGGFLGETFGPALGNIGKDIGKFGKDLGKGTKDVISGIEDWVDGIAESAADWRGAVDDFIDYIENKGQDVKEVLGDIAGWFRSKGQDVRQTLQNISDWFAAKGRAVRQTLQNVSDWVHAKGRVVRDTLQTVSDWVKAKGRAVKNVLIDIKTWFDTQGRAVKNVLIDIKTWFDAQGRAVKNTLSDISTWFTNKGKAVRDTLSSISSWISSGGSSVQGTLNNISSWISSAGSSVQGTLNDVSGWISSSGQAAKDAIDWVASQLDIDLPDPSGALNGIISDFQNFDLPNISLSKMKNWLGLATGGIVSNPTPAVVGEGGETEAVMPLSNMASMLNTAAGENVYSSSDAEGMALKHLPNPKMLEEGGVVTGPTLSMVGEGKESEAVMPLSKLEDFVSSSAPDVTVNVDSEGIGTTIGEVVARKLQSVITNATRGNDNGGGETDTQRLETLLEDMISEMQRDRGDVNLNVDGKTLSRENRKAMDKYDTSREVSK